MLHFFSCCTLFMYCTISCCTFTRCSVLVLHSSLVALFACCNFSCYTLFTLFMLHYFNKCSQDLHKHLRWRALQQNLTKLKIKINISILDVPWESVSAAILHVARFSCCTFLCCTFLILKYIENERKTESTTKKVTLHSGPWTCFTFILISYNTLLSLYSFEWLINWKGTNLLFFWKGIFFAKAWMWVKTKMWTEIYFR